jgi:putative RNA 2'-phosphotransferase
MTEDRIVKMSKYLSKHLRHQPESIGLVLDPEGGWVLVSDLLEACERNRFPITKAQLDVIVAENDKKRFSFDETGTRIRANQGHSTEVDLQLAPATPPEVLYHGTGHGSVAIIEQDGLKKMRRHAVHLSTNMETVIFTVDTQAMRRAGFVFYESDNGVWLVDEVPAQYLTVLPVSDFS